MPAATARLRPNPAVSATSPDGEVAAATRLEVLAAAEQQFVRIERAPAPASEDIGLRSYAADQVT